MRSIQEEFRLAMQHTYGMDWESDTLYLEQKYAEIMFLRGLRVGCKNAIILNQIHVRLTELLSSNPKIG